ncbi:MAG: hypothetical protein LBD58_00105 [Treponema sp.]|nr:hypothetical protein [Treponema sp.]
MNETRLIGPVDRDAKRGRKNPKPSPRLPMPPASTGSASKTRQASGMFLHLILVYTRQNHVTTRIKAGNII